jgi:hypothetical protein
MAIQQEWINSEKLLDTSYGTPIITASASRNGLALNKIYVYNTDSSARDVTLRIFKNVTSNTREILFKSIPARSNAFTHVWQDDGAWILMPSDYLEGIASLTNVIHVCVFGVENIN